MLDGVNVALGVTGSIAAVRCVELIHEFKRHGATVRVVMSSAATDIVHPWSLEFASEHSVVTELTGAVEHIELCAPDGWADVFVVAPATANTIGKVATGIDDTPVTTCATTAVGSSLPLVVAPAMHDPMYDHPVVDEHLETIAQRFDAEIAPPRMEENKAKIASDETIITATARAVNEQPLNDHHIVVTSGSTTESIDPVRILRTRASGKTGRAVARALFVHGATVTLLHDGPRAYPFADVIQIESAAELEEAAVDAVTSADAFVAAAAVSDFTTETRPEKIRSGEPITLDLQPTTKTIESIRTSAPELPIVGFKAESTDDDETLIEQARELIKRYDLLFTVANDASVMGEDVTRVLVVTSGGVDELTGTKDRVAMGIVGHLATHLDQVRTK